MKKSGFSLIEIMGAVAIVGILVAIAYPKYRSWKAHSIQTQAKTELSMLYTAEKTFKEEYKTFHWHLPAIGFVPAGITLANNYPPSTNSDRFFATGLAHNGGGGFASLASLGLVAPGGFTFTAGTSYVASSTYCGSGNSTLTSLETTTGIFRSNVTTTTFDAISVGCPLRWVAGGSSNVDVWTIDEELNLAQLKEQQ